MTFPRGLFPPPSYPKVSPPQSDEDAYRAMAFGTFLNPVSNWSLQATNRGLTDFNAHETPAWDPVIRAFRPYPIEDLIAAAGGAVTKYASLHDVHLTPPPITGQICCVYDQPSDTFRASNLLYLADKIYVRGDIQGVSGFGINIHSDAASIELSSNGGDTRVIPGTGGNVYVETIEAGVDIRSLGTTSDSKIVLSSRTITLDDGFPTRRVIVDYSTSPPEFRVDIPSYGTGSFPSTGVLTKAVGDDLYSEKVNTETRLTTLEGIPPDTNANPGGGSLILTAPYTIPCSSVAQGVYVKVAAPMANLFVGQVGSLFSSSPTGDGEITYIDTQSRLVILSPRMHLRTTNTGTDVVAAMLYINGAPAGGGVLFSSSIVDNTYPCTLSVPFQAQPLVTGDVLSIYVANLSSTADVELSAMSFLIASASLFNV